MSAAERLCSRIVLGAFSMEKRRDCKLLKLFAKAGLNWPPKLVFLDEELELELFHFTNRRREKFMH